MAPDEVNGDPFMENRHQSDGPEERLFTRSVAAQLARVTVEFLAILEEERLIQPRAGLGGEQCYSAEDICEITRIRRLHQDLGLDLGAVEIVLHMRRRILELLAQVEEMERQLARRESELLAEIEELRRRLGVRVEK